MISKAMNIVKILGLSFDKKKTADLRYGKAQDCKCIATFVFEHGLLVFFHCFDFTKFLSSCFAFC